MGIIESILKHFATSSKSSGRQSIRWGQPARVTALIFKGSGDYDFEVVGEASYQASLSKICGGKTEDGHEMKCAAALILDDNNAYDPNAVAVGVDGQLVGYLPRNAAKDFRRQIVKINPRNFPMGCRAIIRGGWDRGRGDSGHFGIWLDVAQPLSVEYQG